MATNVGNVTQVVGTVTAVDSSGNQRILEVGDQVFMDEKIQTADGSYVAIALANGKVLDIGRSDSVVLDGELLGQADQAVEESGSSADMSVESLQAAIAAGIDPTLALPAAAAGPTADGQVEGPAGAGHSFVIVPPGLAELVPGVPDYETVGFDVAFGNFEDWREGLSSEASVSVEDDGAETGVEAQDDIRDAVDVGTDDIETAGEAPGGDESRVEVPGDDGTGDDGTGDDGTGDDDTGDDDTGDDDTGDDDTGDDGTGDDDTGDDDTGDDGTGDDDPPGPPHGGDRPNAGPGDGGEGGEGEGDDDVDPGQSGDHNNAPDQPPGQSGDAKPQPGDRPNAGPGDGGEGDSGEGDDDVDPGKSGDHNKAPEQAPGQAAQSLSYSDLFYDGDDGIGAQGVYAGAGLDPAPPDMDLLVGEADNYDA